MTSAEGGPQLTVALVGTGLIGTSIALAADRAGATVRGYDPDRSALAAAGRVSSLSARTTLAGCVEGADVVVVCTPVGAVAGAVAEALAATAEAVVTDVASVKGPVVLDVERAAGPDAARFVGGHPMAGSERGGPEGAAASLLEGASWVLTPGPHTDPRSIDRVERFVAALGARPVTMDAERHDRLVAVVSHLPQVVATSLMSMANERNRADPATLELAASGFRDLTRLAASDPELWVEIVLANREAIDDALAGFFERLQQVRELIAGDRSELLEELFAEAQRARLTLGAKPKIRTGVVLLEVPVPDRPGALAEVTAALSESGVNIEDLQIVHSPWGGSGVVHVTVQADVAEAAVEGLAGAGFPARVRERP